MTAITDFIVKNFVNQQMTNPAFGAMVSEYLKRMRLHSYGWHLDAICQKFEQFNYDIYDACPFSQVHVGLCLGQIAAIKLDIGKTPGPDDDLRRNNQMLKSLPEGFHGKFYGGTQDEDGYIIIEKPVMGYAYNVKTRKREGFVFEGHYPLEVGATSAIKSLLSLRSCGRLARWPYGHKSIYLMQADESFLIGYASNGLQPIGKVDIMQLSFALS